jgi:hypothetical protein
MPDGAVLSDERALWLVLEHGGSADKEWVRLHQRVRSSGGAECVPKSEPADRGDFRCVLLSASGETLFVRPFNSIFAEWATIEEARTTEQSFLESVLVPEPSAPVRLRVDKRGSQGAFEPLYEGQLDPAGASEPEPLEERELIVLKSNGPSRERANLVLAGEGYTYEERDRFVVACEALLEHLFETEPYASHAAAFNARAIFAPCEASGISDPGTSTVRATQLGATFGALVLDRYVLPFDDRGMRRMIDGVPCDALIVVCNTEKYGGGGLFNRFTVVAGHNPELRYLAVHELGHSFGGLADEYYAAAVPYATPAVQVEPWEPNVTPMTGGTLKWRALVDLDIPTPTPWKKAEYEAATRTRAETPAERKARQKLEAEVLASDPLVGRVGAFEGAMYRAIGMYRPEVRCLMFNQLAGGFCHVCRDAITRRIEHFTAS